MTGIRARGLAALVLIVSLAACKKEGGGGDAAGLPADMQPHPAKGDPARLVMPPLFASVPADTPYLFAGVDALPPEFLARLERIAQPLIGMATTALDQARSESPLFDAVMAELSGKWNAAGMASLGLSTDLRYAIYGLGLQPVVVRLTVKDDKALRATVERIAARAGKELPAMAVKDGRSYWQHDSDDLRVVVSLADNQLIAAFGKAADVEAKLGLILGSEKPAQNMADGAVIKQVMARHGFGGQMIGIADTRRIAGLALEAAGAPTSPACNAALDQLGAAAPRLVYGVGDLSAVQVTGAYVLELSPDAVSALRGIKVEMPGLASALSGHPLFALAAAVDLPKAQQLAGAVAGRFKQLGEACGLDSLVATAARAARTVTRPLPEPFGSITGGALIVDQLVFPAGRTGGTPERLEGVALVTSPDAKAVFDKVIAMQGELKNLGLAADGKLHDIQSPMALPFAVSVGVGDRAIVANAGDASRASAERLLGARGGGKVPLFAAVYELDKLFDLAAKSAGSRSPAEAAMRASLDKIKGVFGRTGGVLDVTDHGLALWTMFELK
jgi:hypothetical protein